ncbi:MAG: dTDP-4-dehydrorhamnose 3,5-epimerase family protein [bacterium]|nr:dTDP-4-dehydrorhamnose 3,5-epimerase family protein [bacterium]
MFLLLGMIDGVKIKTLKVFPDKIDLGEQIKTPGFLMEVLRNDEGLLPRFGQSTFTVAYEGAIKGFHWHKKQDDLWFIATGRAMVVLYDLREGSSTKGETQVMMAGMNDYKLIVIPKGVAHGYKVIGKEPVILFYHTTECYNPKDPDEHRIAWDDKKIGFDWSMKNQ